MTVNLAKNHAVILHKNHPDMNRRHRTTCANFCLLITGTLLIISGISISVYFEAIYDFLISNAMTFDNGTEPYKAWTKNEPPLDMDIYLFNWTNPQDLGVEGVKPIFQELGPYRFKEMKEKVNVTWHPENNTISYKHKKMYWYDEENSVCKLEDEVVTINMVALTAAYNMREYGYFVRRALSPLLSMSSTLFVRKTAGELLFDGYRDNIISTLKIFGQDVEDKFGLFYGANNSAGRDGDFSMFTKVDGNFGKIASWNYAQQSEFFEGSCNDLRGSTGEFYPINRNRDYIELFSSELCKSAKMEYEKDVFVKGVRGYKYTGKYIFDNGTTRPENKCFCNGQCVPSGVFNVSSCRNGSPTFLSMPHFYNADPSYVDAIEGVKPEEKHEFYITLEPKSGIVIDIGAKMQVNMLLQPFESLTLFERVPKIFVPIFYFDQTIMLRDDLAPSLRMIQNLPDISNIVVGVLVGLGIILYLLYGLVVFCCARRKSKNEKNQLAHNPPVSEELPLTVRR